MSQIDALKISTQPYQVEFWDGVREKAGWINEDLTHGWKSSGSLSGLHMTNLVYFWTSFLFHKQKTLVNPLLLKGTFAEYISARYTSILQPCDVVVTKSLKLGIKKEYMT